MAEARYLENTLPLSQEIELIAEFDDSFFGLESPSLLTRSRFNARHAARAIFFDAQGRIALMHVTKASYHKLPGGGIESGESWDEAFMREALEETGCRAQLRNDVIGQIIEWRAFANLKQVSYCGIADLVGAPGLPSLTQQETSDGFVLKWVTIPEALLLLQADEPTNLEGHFIRLRDMIFIQEAQRKGLN